MQDQLLYAMSKVRQSREDKRLLAGYFYNLYAIKALVELVCAQRDQSKEALNEASDVLDELLQRGRDLGERLLMYSVPEITECEAVVFSDMTIHYPLTSNNDGESADEKGRQIPLSAVDGWLFETDYHIQQVFCHCFPVVNDRLSMPQSDADFRKLQRNVRSLQKMLLRKTSLAQISRYILATSPDKLDLDTLARLMDQWDRRLFQAYQSGGPKRDQLIADQRLQRCIFYGDYVYAFFRSERHTIDVVHRLLIPLSLKLFHLANFNLAELAMEALKKRPEVLDFPVDFAKYSDFLLSRCRVDDDYRTLITDQHVQPLLPLLKFKTQGAAVIVAGEDGDLFHEHWFLNQPFSLRDLEDRHRELPMGGTDLKVHTPFLEPATYDPKSYALFVNDFSSPP